MRADEILCISDEDGILKMDYIFQSFYGNILYSIYCEATELFLRLHQNKWHTSMKIGGEFSHSADPFAYKASQLLPYVRLICHGVHNPEDMGGLDGITILRVLDELIIGMFWFGEDQDGQWLSLRLLYGDTAPSAAKAILDKWNKIANFTPVE